MSNPMVQNLKDSDWLGRSFLLAGHGIEADAVINRYRTLSTADLKYTGSGLGENTVINSPPQFTPLADIPVPGLLSNGDFSLVGDKGLNLVGMGPGYSEAIDDQKQVLHLRFGVLKYKGLVSFFTSFYDSEAATLARYGRVGIGYYFGALVGSILILPLAPFILAGTAWNYLMGRQSTRYMDFKPAMPLFWTRLQVIYNTIGSLTRIIPSIVENTGHWGVGADTWNDLSTEGTEAYRDSIQRIVPKIFKNGRIDVYNVANGGARRERQHYKKISEIAEKAVSKQDLQNKILAYLDSRPLTSTAPTQDFDTYLKEYLNSTLGSIQDLSKETDGIEDATSRAINQVASGEDPTALAKLQQVGSSQQTPTQNATNTDASSVDSAVAGIAGTQGFLPDSSSGLGSPTATNASQTGNGATTGSYEVDANGNQISPNSGLGSLGIENPNLATRKNGQEMMSTVQTRAASAGETTSGTDGDTVFSFVRGWFNDAKNNLETEWQNGAAFLNLAVNYTGAGTASFSNTLKDTMIKGTLNGLAGSARDARVSLSDYQTGFGFMDQGIKMVGQVFGGVMDKVQMSGLLALAGNAFVDIPKQWDDSTATFPTMSFTMELRNPYGNEFSRYMNLYMPVAALLSGTLPHSTGPQSYTSPSVCEAFCRGIGNIRLGMITDLSITAGTGNLGYNDEFQPLAFDVSFTIADLSSLMHAPIGNGFNPLRPTRRVMDDDNAFNDYLCTITGLHMRDMVDSRRKLSIRAAARWMDYKAMLSPGNVASRIGGTDTVQILNKLVGASSQIGV